MEIIWSEMALQQLYNILEIVQEEYGQRIAKKTFERIDSKIKGLLRFPESGTPDFSYSSFAAQENIQVRHLLVTPNVIYYNINEDKINIMLIAHVKQSPQTVIDMIKKYFEHQRG